MLNSKNAVFSRRYLHALRADLKKTQPDSKRAAALGLKALSLGIGTLELAQIHEQAVLALTPAHNGSTKLLEGLRKESGLFFLNALAPTDNANRHLKQEVVRRQAAEVALVKCEMHYREMLKQSRFMEQRLRHLSHQILSAQEEEKKEISRELHDQIAQMLVGINAHLAILKGAAAISGADLNRKIRSTQRIVEKAVGIVHRFASELRPPVLDDLGLIPALQSYAKEFSAQTGMPVRLTLFAGVERLNSDKRIVLYRVTQAALTNVARHAKASQVMISIVKAGHSIKMRLHDNGKSFDVENVLLSKKNKRLGLIGMRERVEMVGGSFSIQSAPEKGTTIEVVLPFEEDRKAPGR